MRLRKGMVLSVGTGTRPDVDMAEPLSKSVQEANPDAVVLVVTEGSAPVGQRIREQVTGVVYWEEVRLSSGDDIEEAFRGCVEAFRRLFALGLSPQAITADYTSGTKAMTAGLALAAVAFRCGTLRYITGRREAGVVVSGTERFEVTPPSAVLALYDLGLVEEMVKGLQFEPARRLCEKVNPYLLAEEDRRRREALLRLAEAYEAWDRFEHHKAARIFGDTDMEAVPEDLRLDSGTVRRVHALGNAVYQGRFTDDLMADLLANAARRLIEGRWDDAVARLYRVVEMVAQRILRERHDQDTGAVDLSRLPESAREVIPETTPPVRLGLEKAYRLLERLGEPIGGAIEHLRGLLQERNQSILAHGTRSVGEKAASRFFRETVGLVRREVPGLDACLHTLQFPWLRDSMKELFTK